MNLGLRRTPPFSSEEDLDEEDVIQAYGSPDLLPVKPSRSNKSNVVKSTTSRSDTDWTEGSEVEELNVLPKPAGDLGGWQNLLGTGTGIVP